MVAIFRGDVDQPVDVNKAADIGSGIWKTQWHSFALVLYGHCLVTLPTVLRAPRCLQLIDPDGWFARSSAAQQPGLQATRCEPEG